MATGSSGLKPLAGEDYVRSYAGPEVKNMVDEARNEAYGRIEAVKAEFSEKLNKILKDFTEKDFAGQLSDAVDEEMKSLETSLSDARTQAGSLQKQIAELEKLPAADDTAKKINALAAELSQAATDLDSEIEKARTIAKNTGAVVGKVGRRVASSFVGGLI